jgi:hypothetical protein
LDRRCRFSLREGRSLSQIQSGHPTTPGEGPFLSAPFAWASRPAHSCQLLTHQHCHDGRRAKSSCSSGDYIGNDLALGANKLSNLENTDFQPSSPQDAEKTIKTLFSSV